MSKKTILNENTIRRFMKLANIEPLAESYLDQFNEEEDEMMGADAEAEAPMDAAPMDAAPMDDAPVDDMEAGGAAASVPEEAVAEIVDAIATAVADVTGTPVSSESDVEAEAPVDAAPADDLAPAPEEAPEEEAPATRYESKGEDEEEPVEESEEKEDEEDKDLTQEDLIQRVAKRVAERLIKTRK